MRRSETLLFVLLFLAPAAFGQDTLPRFTVVAKPNNRNVISWTNTFRYTSQISIQRSNDSTRNFKTILTVPDPSVPQNGFVDTKSPAGTVFYRIFIVLDSGKYQFSRSKRPAPDTASASLDAFLDNDNQRIRISDSMTTGETRELKDKLQPAKTPAPPPPKIFIVKRRDTIINRITEKDLKKFRDSLLYTTRDTMLFSDADTIQIKPFIPKEIYRASKYVYTEKFGNVMIDLPDAGKKKYSVSFFEEDKTPLFQIKEVKSPSLVLDKVNFIHSGWFWFELYEDGKLKERHKFFIPKDF